MSVQTDGEMSFVWMQGLQVAQWARKTENRYRMYIKTSSKELARTKSGSDYQWILLRSEWC